MEPKCQKRLTEVCLTARLPTGHFSTHLSSAHLSSPLTALSLSQLAEIILSLIGSTCYPQCASMRPLLSICLPSLTYDASIRFLVSPDALGRDLTWHFHALSLLARLHQPIYPPCQPTSEISFNGPTTQILLVVRLLSSADLVLGSTPKAAAVLFTFQSQCCLSALGGRVT